LDFFCGTPIGYVVLGETISILSRKGKTKRSIEGIRNIFWKSPKND
jgi:hypothetical protein